MSPVGPGKYDDVATLARAASGAAAVVLIVVGGRLGTGFSVQVREDIAPDLLSTLPRALREVADELDRSGGRS